MNFLTSREFNLEVSFAKRVARAEPVLIAERGRPTHVMMRIGDYRRLTVESGSILEILAMPGVADNGNADRKQVDEANRLFAKIQRFCDRALVDMPSHMALIQQINTLIRRSS